MNRTLKFRCWDKNNKKMEYNPRIYWDAANLDDCFKNSSIDREWMQFTGLYDDAGKEIYDGDIRRAEYFFQTEKQEHIAVMEWDKNFNGWMWATVKGTWHDHFNLEVVGNKFENPNLLA